MHFPSCQGPRVCSSGQHRGCPGREPTLRGEAALPVRWWTHTGPHTFPPSGGSCPVSWPMTSLCQAEETEQEAVASAPRCWKHDTLGSAWGGVSPGGQRDRSHPKEPAVGGPVTLCVSPRSPAGKVGLSRWSWTQPWAPQPHISRVFPVLLDPRSSHLTLPSGPTLLPDPFEGARGSGWLSCWDAGGGRDQENRGV